MNPGFRKITRIGGGYFSAVSEETILFLIAFAAGSLLGRVAIGFAPASGAHIGFAVAWIGCAVAGHRMARRFHVSEPPARLSPNAMAGTLGVSVMVLAGFAAAHRLAFGVPAGFAGSWIGAFATQFLLVALPEEAFFRGYFQPSIERRFADRGLPDAATAAIVLTAGFFAVAHAVSSGDVLRLATFVPGCYFGWLRHRSGTTSVPILVHGASNLLILYLEGTV